MLWPKKNSYKEFDNEKKFLWLENSPPPRHNFSNGPALRMIWLIWLRATAKQFLSLHCKKALSNSKRNERNTSFCFIVAFQFRWTGQSSSYYGVHVRTKIIENKRQVEVQELGYPCRNLVIWISNRNERSRNSIIRTWSYFEQVETIKENSTSRMLKFESPFQLKCKLHDLNSIHLLHSNKPLNRQQCNHNLPQNSKWNL